MTLVPSQAWTVNEWADFWRYQIGVNVIPANTREKRTWIPWSQYQDNPILETQHEQWKQNNAFKDGMAIIPGKVWHNTAKKGLYFIFIDLDNQKAIDEFCTRNGVTTPLTELAKVMIIEQHRDDPTKAHAYCYSIHPFTKKSSDIVKSADIPAIEVKGLGEHGIAYCAPSPHKNGCNYEIIWTKEPEIIDELEQHIHRICKKYGIPYLGNSNGNGRSLTPIQYLFEGDTKVYVGHNRHEAVLRIMDSLIGKLNDILPLEKIKQLAWEQSNKICATPLQENELERQWKAALKFIERKNQGKENRKQGNENSESNNNQSQTNASILVDIAKSNTKQFFKDQYGAAFAVVRVIDHNEIISLESSSFKRFLSKLFYDNNDHMVAGTDSINSAIQILQAIAEYDSPTIPLSLRVAWSKSNDSIYYDLTDDKWRCVKVSKDGWDIITDSSILFVRYNQVAQSDPSREYEVDIFEKFFDLTNVKDESGRLLLKIYIVSMFIPDIDHAMLILHGEKGSAKSTLQSMIKTLVDPAKPSLITIPTDKDEFVRQMNHNYVACYDNIKYIPKWFSDEACKAATGVGNTKRKLYTNDEDIVYEYKRCLGFNGINISLTEPDALDRSILIQLDRIRRENNQVKTKIYTEFEEIQPKLLGYIFDVLSGALSIKDSIELKESSQVRRLCHMGRGNCKSYGLSTSRFC